MLSLKLMLAAVFRITAASACVTAAEMAAEWWAKKPLGDARLAPYTVLSCVPGATEALPSALSMKAKAVKKAPVDSQPRSSTPWPLESALA